MIVNETGIKRDTYTQSVKWWQLALLPVLVFIIMAWWFGIAVFALLPISIWELGKRGRRRFLDFAYGS